MDYSTTYDYSSSVSTSSNINGGVIAAIFGVTLVILLIVIISNWKIFKKAGKPGWASIVPLYNVIVLLEIVGRPIWWIVLMLIPFVNIIASIIVTIDLAKSFGKSTAFAIFGLLIFSLIGYPMLAFGSAKYVGPAGPEGKASGKPATA